MIFICVVLAATILAILFSTKLRASIRRRKVTRATNKYIRRFSVLLILFIFSVASPAGGYQGIATTPTPCLPPDPPIDLSAVPVAYRQMIVDAAARAGVSALALAGLAYAESSFRPNPKHIDALDHGMFGLREAPGYHDERARAHGEYDPSIPEQAARIAAGILRDHLERFDGYLPLALTAYHRGAGWAKAHGIDWRYVDRAMEIFCCDKGEA